MTRERLNLGKRGEDVALKKIKELGYKIVARNYRCSLGEVDVVAKDGKCLVFLEIKSRKGRSTGQAKQAVDERKQRQLSKVALTYMKLNGCPDVKARFDVIGVGFFDDHVEVEVIKDAFEVAY